MQKEPISISSGAMMETALAVMDVVLNVDLRSNEAAIIQHTHWIFKNMCQVTVRIRELCVETEKKNTANNVMMGIHKIMTAVAFLAK